LLECLSTLVRAVWRDDVVVHVDVDVREGGLIAVSKELARLFWKLGDMVVLCLDALGEARVVFSMRVRLESESRPLGAVV
jgi:hypothetical protein